jgi:two-component system response regulator RpaA
MKKKAGARPKAPNKRPLPSHLTCGQAAKLLGVAPRTMGKWVDAGMIAGSYRMATEDGSRMPWGDRRVSVHGLREFCRDRNMPAPEVLPEKPLYAVGVPAELLAGLSRFGPAALVEDTHRLCLRLPRAIPCAVLINTRETGRSAAMSCLRALAAEPVKGMLRLIVIAGDDDSPAEVDQYTVLGAVVFDSVRTALLGNALARVVWGDNVYAADLLDAPAPREAAS